MACRHEGELSALLARMHHPPAATPVSNQTTTTAAEKPGQRLTSATTRQPIAIGRTGMYVCDASTLSGSVQVHSVSGTEPASVECCWNGVRERNTVDAGMGGQVETGQGLSSAPGHGRKGLPGCGCTAESIYSYDAVVEFYVGQSATEVWAAGEAGEAIDKLTISDDPTPVGRGATVDTAAGRAALTGTSPPHPNTVRVRLVEAKADVQTLEQFLRGSAMWFVRDALRRGGKVLISCPSGSGPSVMLVLCVLCAYYHEGYTAIRHTCDGDEDGEGEGRQQPVTKVDVNQALIYIERFHPEVARLKKMYLKIANRCLMSASR
ncbi:hypothetical protein SARC_04902 [Sphaeroforma arctica JP610]|uniref:Rit1 DUSP-like domain-containing protein n=1 Tax=Sphaeroforma arctica JP610 TaxID=667725 RepID=A0A0L0G1V4_9EUKA|nr:hypothetical protein SARC_04902 [Sphaeroforma arctica JP610]KNC82819.1 hypothetical protein SARC_04902 [Sphaeroforma arctica JP610]|eukprot:XP_014156721.1 hypothetical protein SARC_04902 [Sphaeroforma arctica JP610]